MFVIYKIWQCENEIQVSGVLAAIAMDSQFLIGKRAKRIKEINE